MSYVGNTPQFTTYAPGQDTFTGDGSTTSFTLSRVATVVQVQVTVDNVVQYPIDSVVDATNGSYTITTSGNVCTLVFTSAPQAPASPFTKNIVVRYIVQAAITTPPGASTVGANQLATTNSPSATGNVLTISGLAPTTLAWTTPSGGVSSFSAGVTGLTPNTASTGAVVLSGTLAVTNGGTGTNSAPQNGQLLIGNGTGYTLATLTAGTNVTIANSSGQVIINSTGSGGGGGSTNGLFAQLFTSSGTFTVPTGVTAARVSVWGGGGGGCGARDTPTRYAGGGGGGGASVRYVTGLTPGGTVTVTVGSGGSGASSSSSQAGQGGTSSFGALLQATGGFGGRGGPGGSSLAGGIGGTGSGGTFNWAPNTVRPNIDQNTGVTGQDGAGNACCGPSGGAGGVPFNWPGGIPGSGGSSTAPTGIGLGGGGVYSGTGANGSSGAVLIEYDATTGSSSGGLGGTQVFTSSGTFTIPSGKTVVKVTVSGGGGGGGGNGGAGGGGAGRAIKYLTGLTAGNTLTVTVGTGGAGGTPGTPGSQGNPGAAGGASSVASNTQSITTISATGGGGGGAANVSSPGAGGTGSNGDFNSGGSDGNGQQGGSSLLGGAAQGNGSAGKSYGGGGGGGTGRDCGSGIGGTGGGGIVIFEY